MAITVAVATIDTPTLIFFFVSKITHEEFKTKLFISGIEKTSELSNLPNVCAHYEKLISVGSRGGSVSKPRSHHNSEN